MLQVMGCCSEDTIISFFFLWELATESLLGILEPGALWVKRNLNQGDGNLWQKIKGT